MRINRIIEDEKLGRFLQDAEEGVLRSLLAQYDEDRAIEAALADIRAKGEDQPALSAAEFRARLRQEKLV